MSTILDQKITVTDAEKTTLKRMKKMKSVELHTFLYPKPGEATYAIWIELMPGSGEHLQDREKYSKLGALFMAEGMQKNGRLPQIKLWEDVPEENRVPDFTGQCFSGMMSRSDSMQRAADDALVMIKNAEGDKRPLWNEQKK